MATRGLGTEDWDTRLLLFLMPRLETFISKKTKRCDKRARILAERIPDCPQSISSRGVTWNLGVGTWEEQYS